MGLLVKTYPYGPMSENTYLVIDEASGDKLIVDPGYYGDDVYDDIGNPDSLKYVLLTHGHFDHLYAAGAYLENFNVKLLAPEKDSYLIHKDWVNDILTRGMKMNNCPEPDAYLTEKDRLTLGETEFSFIDTPGHTEGGMCILADGKLFSGDTLFRLSVGNTTLETGSWDDLKDSIRNKLYVLDEATVVYPGHGSTTTIAMEKISNPYVQVLH